MVSQLAIVLVIQIRAIQPGSAMPRFEVYFEIAE